MSKVLLLESDVKLQVGLKCVLTLKGFNVTVCPTMLQAKKLLEEFNYTAIILDIHHQEENAFNFVKNLRSKGHYVPILFLGERSYQEVLERDCTGLDEYVLKPFTIKVFNEALNKALVKAHSLQKPLLYGDLRIDERLGLLLSREVIVPLGRIEMKILLMLSKRAGKVVSLEKIHSLIKYENVKINVRAFSYITSLRKKLEEAGVRGLKINWVNDGYRLDLV